MSIDTAKLKKAKIKALAVIILTTLSMYLIEFYFHGAVMKSSASPSLGSFILIMVATSSIFYSIEKAAGKSSD